jgi:hypothetical protein
MPHTCSDQAFPSATAAGIAGAGSAVLRVGAPETAQTQNFELRGIALAHASGVPAPGVIAARADDKSVVLLIEYVDGSSRQPVEPDPARLEALGRIAARISTVDPGAAELPVVTHPIPDVDFDELRARAQPQPLLAAAQERVAAIVPDDLVGFVHGDLWSGNTLWRGIEPDGRTSPRSCCASAAMPSSPTHSSVSAEPGCVPAGCCCDRCSVCCEAAVRRAPTRRRLALRG